MFKNPANPAHKKKTDKDLTMRASEKASEKLKLCHFLSLRLVVGADGDGGLAVGQHAHAGRVDPDVVVAAQRAARPAQRARRPVGGRLLVADAQNGVDLLAGAADLLARDAHRRTAAVHVGDHRLGVLAGQLRDRGRDARVVPVLFRLERTQCRLADLPNR
jgi:hypothetical protein